MEVGLGPYRLEVAEDFGPRITSLRWQDGPELLARLGPDAVIEHPGGTYSFRGGHRLWVSPEEPAVTYAPDDHRCAVRVGDESVTVTAPADRAGVEKELTVSREGEVLVVDHLIRWGAGPRGFAPWAITQLPLGGTAIIPLIGEDTSPQANRYVVLWPYTSFTDRRVTLSDRSIVIEAAAGEAVKFGAGPSPGRLAYLRDGVLFTKEVPSPVGTVPDFGAAAQIYVGQGFCELESVGSLPANTGVREATLRERWHVRECEDLETAIEVTLGVA